MSLKRKRDVNIGNFHLEYLEVKNLDAIVGITKSNVLAVSTHSESADSLIRGCLSGILGLAPPVKNAFNM
jgi:hypothetical protein